MIDTTPAGLWQEVFAAEEKRSQHLESMRVQMRRFTGPHYDQLSGSVDNEYDPINQALMFAGVILPAVAYSNPRVKVGTRRPGVQRQDAEALQLALNRWIQEVDLSSTLEELATDFLFNWGVAIVSRERRPGNEEHADPLYWPQVRRIPQEEVSWDARARSWATKRFASHKYTVDHEDLIRRAKADMELPEDDREGWNLDVIERLEPGTKVGNFDDRLQERDQSLNLDRNEIEIREVWLPEVELPEIQEKAKKFDSTPADMGYHGTIYYLVYSREKQPRASDGRFRSKAFTDRAYFPRKPQPHFGPRTGPYVMFGAYYVPSESAPLGPLTAQEAQVSGVNELARSIHDSARQYKRVIAVDELSAESFGKKIQTTLHDNYIGVAVPEDGDVRKALQPVEVMGITEQQLAQLGIEKDWMDEVSGLSEAQRGNLTGATATENAIAGAASNARVEWLARKFERSVRELLLAVAEIMWTDDEVVQPIGSDASEERGANSLMFVGGQPDQSRIDKLRRRFPEAVLPDAPEGPRDTSGATFYDLELEIEPYSMGRANEPQRRAQGAFMIEFATGLAPMLPQLKAIGVDTEELLSTIGDQLGMPRLGRLVDDEQLTVAAEAFTQMQLEASQDGEANASRLKKTTGGMQPHGGGGNKPGSMPGGLDSSSPLEGQRSGQQAAQPQGAA